MLPPHDRQLYVGALKPPVGYVLGRAVATTYSLDLATLLSVPLSLALPNLDLHKLGDQSAIALLQATRTVSDRLTVFVDRGRIAAPGQTHVLYGLLESIVHEVAAPHGGSLHAKVWMLRFDPDKGAVGGEPQMRLVVLSRNMNFDRSWDVSASLDGVLTGRKKSVNNPLLDLLRSLPASCTRLMPENKRTQLEAFAEEVGRTDWELPRGFEEVAFHLLGTGKRPREWAPAASSRLVVISPFVTGPALETLAATTGASTALISRAEELDRVDRDILERFEQVYTLHEAAEREDGEDEEGAAHGRQFALRGLHAKVYLVKDGWNTRLYLGSPNATTAALVAGQNIELLIELSGKTSAVPGRGIDGMLSKDGLLEILTPYDRAAPVTLPDPLVEQADQLLREAVVAIATAPLSITFGKNDALYDVRLALEHRFALDGVAEVRAWLATIDGSAAVEARGLFEEGRLALPPCTPESATTFVTFSLMAPHASAPVTFVLNVPSTTVPVDRDAHVMRVVINNRERFFRYLLGLLEGAEAPAASAVQAGSAGSWSASGEGPSGLLERLVRTRARDPERLEHVRAMVDALSKTPDGAAILSDEFLAVWRVLSEVAS